MSPFHVCYGKHPLTPMSPVIDAANATWQAEPHDHKDFLHATKFLADKRSIVKLPQEAMEEARKQMADQADEKRNVLLFLKEIKSSSGPSSWVSALCLTRSYFNSQSLEGAVHCKQRGTSS